MGGGAGQERDTEVCNLFNNRVGLHPCHVASVRSDRESGSNSIDRAEGVGRIRIMFLADDHDASKLPSWVKRAKDTTDGHLSELAKANGCILATLDIKIPGSFLIP